MTENRTRPTSAGVDDFVASVTDERKREDCVKLVDLMRGITGENPVMWGPSIIGFGKYHYTYASGREGDMFLVGFSPRKQALTVYGIEREAELMTRSGRYKTGKSCLYIKRLADVDQSVLEELLKRSVAQTTLTCRSC